MRERRSIAKVMPAGYPKASKKRKGGMLNELVAVTDYNRRYAIGLLRGHGELIKLGHAGSVGRNSKEPGHARIMPRTPIVRSIWLRRRTDGIIADYNGELKVVQRKSCR